MVKIKRMMETDDNGVQWQFMPITHVSAILGLDKLISGETKVLSVNGKIGAVVINKSDLGLENAITELPYASETTDGILTAELYQKLLNSGEGDYILPIATVDKLGGIRIGELLTIDATGKVSALKQTDFNFTQELKSKLESLKNLTAGTNISISDEGVISALVESSTDYQLPTASAETKGGVKVGRGLTITDETLSADPQLNYTAGVGISISNTGVISATGGGSSGGVSEDYLNEKLVEIIEDAREYTDSKIPSVSFEKVGEV